MQALLERRGAAPVALSGEEAFRASCLRHDAAAARAILAAEPDLARTSPALLAASSFGDAEAVGLLLELGADVHAVDPDGISPLQRAVQSGSLPTVDLLLAAGADVNRRDNKWRGTALSWALVLGRPELFERLIPLSSDGRALASLPAFDRLKAVLAADPSLANHHLAESGRPTPLYCLPDDDDAAVEAVRILLAHGADPAFRDAKGRTPAESARARGLDEAADLIEAATGSRRRRRDG